MYGAVRDRGRGTPTEVHVVDLHQVPPHHDVRVQVEQPVVYYTI